MYIKPFHKSTSRSKVTVKPTKAVDEAKMYGGDYYLMEKTLSNGEDRD